jgi:hypothetical protein
MIAPKTPRFEAQREPSLANAVAVVRVTDGRASPDRACGDRDHACRDEIVVG